MSMTEDATLSLNKALGKITSGLYILTALGDAGERPVAVLVSWVQQAAFNPPSVSVAITRDRAGRISIEKNKQFALAVVPQDDLSLMKKYARGIKPGVDPFEGLQLTTTPAGLPVPANALAWLDCTMVSVCDFGADHDLLLATVTAGGVLRDGAGYAHQRNSGMKY
jgi:3-hydroxy-9,10-secoandrosta-1,3,5(10)-triene-9,17-dione monooxygenase reductase component